MVKQVFCARIVKNFCREYDDRKKMQKKKIKT